VTVTDQAGKVRRSVTNALGQLTRVDEPDAGGQLGDASSPNQPTYYTYNTLGKMVQVNQGVQNRYFLYDSLGRLLRVRQPEQEVNTYLNTSGNPGNNSWTAGFTYDANGNVLTTTDANNVTITTAYDALNRQYSRTYSDSTPDVSYIYDDPLVANSKGKLTSVSSSVSESRYTSFDLAGRLLEYKQITDRRTYTSSYEYNLSGALIQETYPSGRVVRNTLDANGDLSIVKSRKNASHGFWNYADAISRDSAGNVTKMQLGNGLWQTSQFNSRLQVSQLALGVTSTDTSLWKLDYEFGELQTDRTVDAAKNNGNIGKLTLTVSGTNFVQEYKYDTLNRLTEAKEVTGSTQNWIQQFGYDRYGNRTSFSETVGSRTINTTPTVDANTNRFLGGQGFSYDVNGNIIQDIDPKTSHSRSFTFDGDNKQTEVKDLTNSNHLLGTYYYDGEGHRVKKVTDSETTTFVYSLGRIVAEYSTMVSSTPSVGYTTADHLGSPRVITDQTGEVRSRRDFLPFGEEIYSGIGPRTGDEGLKYSSSVDDIRRKFSVYQRDEETELDFAQLRMYSSSYGRFTGTDPVAADVYTPPSLNRYQYCLNNPLRFIDLGGGYDEEVHRDLTAALAVVVGFSEQQGNVIGNADQWLDDRKSGLGAMPSDHLADLAVQNRIDWHFTTEGRRSALLGEFNGVAIRGSGDAALAALGTYLHPEQDSFSHEGFNAYFGQGSALPDNWDWKHPLDSANKAYAEMAKYDKTTFNPEKAVKMARDTLAKLLAARNLLAASGRVGTLRDPVPWEKNKFINDKLWQWANTEGRDEKRVILIEIMRYALQYRDAAAESSGKARPRQMKTKTTVRVIVED